MLSSFILENAATPDQQAIVTQERSTSWAELRQTARSLQGSFAGLKKRRVGISFRPQAESFAALAALDALECDAFLFDPRMPAGDVLQLARECKLGSVLLADGGEFEPHKLEGEESSSGGSTVTILTSGSTGAPKAVRHSWESLCRPVRKGRDSTTPRWLLTYRPHLYAGLQVMLQCFANAGTLAVPAADADSQSVASFMVEAGVHYVSATPSYWRRLLMFADGDLLKRAPLRQITLGGEVVDQPVLNKLSQYFPAARLVHIYATTELGRCFAVSDGLAGFPVSYLQGALPDGTELRLREGELLVRSPNAMKMYDPYSALPKLTDQWFATGDLVEIREDRVYFVGRATDMINVAGSKVHPVEVERVLRTIPGVSDVRVFGKASSIAGQLVACEIVPESNQDWELLRAAVARACNACLATYQRPRLIKLVEQIDLSSAGKTLRGKPA